MTRRPGLGSNPMEEGTIPGRVGLPRAHTWVIVFSLAVVLPLAQACSSSGSASHTHAAQSTAVITNNLHQTVRVAYCPSKAAPVTSLDCGTASPRALNPGVKTTFSFGPSEDGGDPGGKLAILPPDGPLRCIFLAGAPAPANETLRVEPDSSHEQCG
jgi:hypothetical protein